MNYIKNLRERAEKELEIFSKSQNKSLLNTQKLIYELEVNQIELKMQNEELHLAQTEITSLRDKYQELYDYAPVGYVTLDQNGLIETSNLKGARFLGLARDKLVDRPIQKSIVKEDQDRFHIYLQNVLHCGKQMDLDLRMLKQDQSHFFVRLDTIAIFKPDLSFSHFKMTLIDISEYKQAEQQRQQNETQLRESLKEKEILMQEIHHRVKNNLQMIISLLRLQARSIEQPFAIQQLQDSQQRIQVISNLHETLYQSYNFARIAPRPYFDKLLHQLCFIFPIQDLDVKLEVSIEEIALEQALYCGLVVNELVTNALKYAFPSDWKGQAKLTLTLEENESEQCILRVIDNGIGMPPQLNQETLGLKLVEMFVKKLKAKKTQEIEVGTSIQLMFKKAPLPA